MEMGAIDLKLSDLQPTHSETISQLYQVKSGYENLVNSLMHRVKSMEKQLHVQQYLSKPATDRPEEDGENYLILSNRQASVPRSA